MVLARGNNGKRKGGLDVDLYISRLGDNNAWSQPLRLPISDSTGLGWFSCVFGRWKNTLLCLEPGWWRRWN